jgi:hypothetical protein
MHLNEPLHIEAAGAHSTRDERMTEVAHWQWKSGSTKVLDILARTETKAVEGKHNMHPRDDVPNR